MRKSENVLITSLGRSMVIQSADRIKIIAPKIKIIAPKKRSVEI